MRNDEAGLPPTISEIGDVQSDDTESEEDDEQIRMTHFDDFAW